MNDLTKKALILEDAGYRYVFDRRMYVNREKKKAFSVPFIQDNSEEELQSRIREDTADSDWRFFSSERISDAVKRELVQVLADDWPHG